jgi:hypothetical protein
VKNKFLTAWAWDLKNAYIAFIPADLKRKTLGKRFLSLRMPDNTVRKIPILLKDGKPKITKWGKGTGKSQAIAIWFKGKPLNDLPISLCKKIVKQGSFLVGLNFSPNQSGDFAKFTLARRKRKTETVVKPTAVKYSRDVRQKGYKRKVSSRLP